MGRAEMSLWTCTLSIFLCLGQHFVFTSARSPVPPALSVACETESIVVIPAVLHSGEKTDFCVTVLRSRGFVGIGISLKVDEHFNTLRHSKNTEENWAQNVERRPSFTGFPQCFWFRVPFVKKDSVAMLRVDVTSNEFRRTDIRKVLIKARKPNIIISLSLPVYHPGDNVLFKVAALNKEMKLTNAVFNSIVIRDPHKNKIGQWLNVPSNNNILKFSYHLSSQATEGSYTITVKTDKHKVVNKFRVERIILPKFKTTVLVPKQVSTAQKGFEVVVCAKQIFGNPVQGKIRVKVCRPLKPNTQCSSALIDENSTDLHIMAPCKTKVKQTHMSGCTSLHFQLSDFTPDDQKALLDVLSVTATVEEEGTCISQTMKEIIKISYIIGRLLFLAPPRFFVPGRPLFLSVKAIDFTGKPVPFLPLFMFVKEKGSDVLVASFNTNQFGLQKLTFNTFGRTKDIVLFIRSTLGPREEQTPFFLPAILTVHLLAPPLNTVHFLRLAKINRELRCGTVEELTVEYSVSRPKCGLDFAPVYLYVISGGKIITVGLRFIFLRDKVNAGRVIFPLKVTPDIAPRIQVLTFLVLGCDKVLAYSTEFLVERCLLEANVAFSSDSSVPGQTVELQLEGPQNSLCGVNIFSQNVLRKKPGGLLTQDKIFDLLDKGSPIPEELEESGECLLIKPKNAHHGRIRRETQKFSFSQFPCLNQDHEDPYTAAKYVGQWFLSSMISRSPTCLKVNKNKYFLGPDQLSRPETDVPEVEHLPYPEELPPACSDAELTEPITALPFSNLLFDVVKVGDNGTYHRTLTVPKYPTPWVTEAFCVSSVGFSVAPRAGLTVTQTLGLHLSLPPCIVLEESFTITATLVNYLRSPVLIQIVPICPAFILESLSDDYPTFCLCGKKYKTLKWKVTPKFLGHFNVTLTAKAVSSNTVCCQAKAIVPEYGHTVMETQSITIRSKGTEVIKSSNWLLCPKGQHLTRKIDVRIPPTMIQGSLNAEVVVSGNIFSTDIQNLDQLEQDQYRSGDQNIARMAIVTCLLQYLDSTEQLTPEIKRRGVRALTAAYQTQLNYKANDGGFRLYTSKPPSPWLTALVLKVFHKAKDFIYIDPKIFEVSMAWLACQQRQNGCFKVSGKLFSNNIKGDVNDEIFETAFISASFLEMDIPVNNPVVKKGLSCLKKSIKDLNDKSLATALLAYVFRKAGRVGVSSDLLKKMQGELLLWPHTDKRTSTSSSVVTRSYLLLASICNSTNDEDLKTASKIVEWLVEKKDVSGNSLSLQEKMVFYQTLTHFFLRKPNSLGSSRVTIFSPSSHLTFYVNHLNRLNNQAMTLYDYKGKYNVKVEETACAAVQVIIRYSVPTITTGSSDLSVEVDTVIGSGKPPGQKVTLKLKSSYRGNRGCADTVILDIRIPSGYRPEDRSLRNLFQAQQVVHVEYRDCRVIVTIHKLCEGRAVLHMLKLVREHVVLNLQPAIVRIYDVQHPGDGAETEYWVCTSDCPKPCPVSTRLNHFSKVWKFGQRKEV